MATSGGFCENDAMYQASNLSPNPIIASTILDVPFGSAYGGQPRNYLGHPDKFSGGKSVQMRRG